MLLLLFASLKPSLGASGGYTVPTATLRTTYLPITSIGSHWSHAKQEIIAQQRTKPLAGYGQSSAGRGVSRTKRKCVHALFEWAKQHLMGDLRVAALASIRAQRHQQDSHRIRFFDFVCLLFFVLNVKPVRHPERMGFKPNTHR